MLIKSFDLYELNVIEWNDCKEPLGLVQIAQNIGETAESYLEIAAFLNDKGYIVVCADYRQFTAELSQIERNEYIADCVKDLAVVSKYFSEKYKDLKLILLCGGFGSYLSQIYISKFGRFLDGLLLGGSSYLNAASIALSIAAGKLESGIKLVKKSKDNLDINASSPLNIKRHELHFFKSYGGDDDDDDDEKKIEVLKAQKIGEILLKNMLVFEIKKGFDNIDKRLPIRIICTETADKNAKKSVKMLKFYKKLNCADVRKFTVESLDIDGNILDIKKANLKKLKDCLDRIDKKNW